MVMTSKQHTRNYKVRCDDEFECLKNIIHVNIYF